MLLFMNKRGEDSGTWSTIRGAILTLITVIVIIVVVIVGMTVNPLKATAGGYYSEIEQKACKAKGGFGVKDTYDSDTFPAECDICPYADNYGTTQAGIFTEFLDRDNDGLPDACDQFPDTSKEEMKKMKPDELYQHDCKDWCQSCGKDGMGQCLVGKTS